MARSFVGIATFPYIGTFYRVPVWKGGGKAPAGICVPLNINWNTYWQLAGNPSNVGVVATLAQSQSGAGSIIDKIVSIYIDNTGSNVPIYVTFPDTNFVAVAPPNTAAWYPVITNQKVVLIFGEGLSTVNVSTTRIFVTDIFVPPYADAEINFVTPNFIGSPNIQRGNILTPGFGSPALGDQLVSLGGNTTLPNNSTDFVLFDNIFGSPYANGFIYLVSYNIFIVIKSVPSAINKFALQNSTGSNILWNFPRLDLSAPVNTPMNPITAINGNIRLDATDTFRIVCTVAALGADVIQFYFNATYTVNPQ